MPNAPPHIALEAGVAAVQRDEASQSKSRGSWGSKRTVTTRDSLDQTTALATTFSGDRVSLGAGRDIAITGSNVVSDNGTTLAAQNNLNIAAATNTTVEGHFRDEKKSGIFSGGGELASPLVHNSKAPTKRVSPRQPPLRWWL